MDKEVEQKLKKNFLETLNIPLFFMILFYHFLARFIINFKTIFQIE